MEAELRVHVVFVGVSAGNWADCKDHLDSLLTMQKPIKLDQLRIVVNAYNEDELD